MQRVFCRSIPSISKRCFSEVAFKVKYTDVKGTEKMYDIKAPEGEKLLDSIKMAGIPIRSTCNGNCVCGTCVVQFSPALHDQTIQSAKEAGLLRRKGKTGEGLHLACQTYTFGMMEGETIEINYCRK